MTHLRRLLPLLALPLLAAGCDGTIALPKTVPVSGSVVLKAKNKPLPGVTVTFHPQFDMGAIKWTPSGVTNQDGKFTLSTGAASNGAPPGQYKVTYELLRAGSDARGLDTEIDAWKGKYANLDAAQTVTVGSGPTELEPFTIE